MIRRKKVSELGREGCEALLRKPAFDEVELGEKARARIKESFGEELSAVQVVQRIVDDVRCRKNEALCDYTQRFDGAQLTADTLEVTAAEWEEACQAVDEALLASIRRAVANVRRYHSEQLP